MKKFFKSKGFLVTVLSVSCIAILAVCWLVGRDTKTAFLPDGQPPAAVQEEWEDTPDAMGSSQALTDSGIPSQDGAEEKLEDYPKVADDSEQEVVIDFTPAETKDETPPLLWKARLPQQTPVGNHPRTRQRKQPLLPRTQERMNPRLPAPPMKTELYTIPFLDGSFPDRSTSPLWIQVEILTRWSGTWETDTPIPADIQTTEY